MLYVHGYITHHLHIAAIASTHVNGFIRVKNGWYLHKYRFVALQGTHHIIYTTIMVFMRTRDTSPRVHAAVPDHPHGMCRQPR